MSFREPCHMPFRKLIPPFTLTDDYDVKPSNAAFYGEQWGTWTYDDEFSILFLNLDEVLKNSSPGKIAYIWQIERVQTGAI